MTALAIAVPEIGANRADLKLHHYPWFVWQHASGEWYFASMSNAESLDDAALNVTNESKVYCIGGGGPHSMVFTCFGSNILKMWARNADIA